MTKRKFKASCKNYECKEEFVVEIEDGSSCEQEAANALVRKLESHFKDKHPEEKRDEGNISVKQGEKWATLQADGTIKEIAPKNAFLDTGISQTCHCGQDLIFFVDGSIESHICSKVFNSKNSQQVNSDKTNWIPLIIGGTFFLTLVGISVYFARKSDKK